jgi:3-oxoacyl-[acyl-carrier protein] reductase
VRTNDEKEYPSVTSLNGRRIIVTGGATGIGNGAVRAFAAAGATVAATWHTTEPEDRVDAAVHWFRCDLRDEAAVRAGFEMMSSAIGGLDVLYHAAATWSPSKAGDVTEDQLDSQFADTFKATVWVDQSAFRLMRERGGRIINTGSQEAVVGSVSSPVYAATKGAVHTWTRSCARAWAEYNITVNTIAPAMWTRGTDRARALSGAEQFDAALKAIIPLRGRPGDPATDLGPMLVFLASEGSRFITGQLLAVDGGLMMLGA